MCHARRQWVARDLHERAVDRRRRGRHEDLGRRPRGLDAARAARPQDRHERRGRTCSTSSSRRSARPGPARAVGVAVPSVVDFETGRVRASVNVPLADIALRDVLRERLGMPVVVDNDATCAALAEAYDDDGALVARHLVMFTIGTGVGGGIVIDGRVYRGATGAAAELGHTIVGADLRARAVRARRRLPAARLARVARRRARALNELGAEHGIPRRHRRRRRARRPPRRARRDRAARPAARRRDRQRDQHVRPRPRRRRRRRLRGGRAAARARARGGRALRPARRRHEDADRARRATAPRAGVRGAALLAGQEAAHEAGVRVRVALAVDHAGVPLHDARPRRARSPTATRSSTSASTTTTRTSRSRSVARSPAGEARARHPRLRLRRGRVGGGVQAARHPRRRSATTTTRPRSA